MVFCSVAYKTFVIHNLRFLFCSLVDVSLYAYFFICRPIRFEVGLDIIVECESAVS